MAESRRWLLWFWGLLSLYAAIFLLYSQTWAFAWDETYHLLAAQLILAGKKPYLDFCFPQTPFNAYWNAVWMRVFGQSWHVAHALQAMLTIGAVLLTADYMARRLPIPTWRIAGALTAALATGLNAMVFLYGPLSQPYGMCLFLLVAAFRFAVVAVEHSSALWTAAAGLCVGIAAGSSLLTAAAVPVLLVWILVYNRAGGRARKFAAFAIGTAIPFLPALWLFTLNPRVAWFNLVQYHAYFRKLYWPETTRHDLEILTSWIDSGQALTLGLLALSGVIYVARRSGWPPELKAEFYLCAWLAAGITAEVGRAHPTFAQYFLLIVPFLAILATVGLYAIGSRVLEPDRPAWPVALFTALLIFGLANAVYSRREDVTWARYERLSRKIDSVTPPNVPVFANEPIYFLTKRVPPSGYELDYSHKVDLPPAERAALHLLTEADVKNQVQSGMFATAYSCEQDEIDDLGMKKVYNRRMDVGDCVIFWDRVR
jgi:4-amino-4-deoxy-L-arabinose transferase-like glycosyltransferase